MFNPKDREWIEVTHAHLDELYSSVDILKYQLYVALGVLMDLGFSLEDFSDFLPTQ